jgi:chromate reductase
MKKLAVIVASTGKNLELGEKIKSHAIETGFEAEVINLVELDLPLYSTESEQKGIPPKAVELTKKVSHADSLVVISPEYNGGIAPTLNNAIAWISRGSEDWREAFNGKPAIIATHSGSGGMHALMAMRMQLSYIGMNVLGRQLQTNYSKELSIESLDCCLKQLT